VVHFPDGKNRLYVAAEKRLAKKLFLLIFRRLSRDRKLPPKLVGAGGIC
jgi:hypothetical protein